MKIIIEMGWRQMKKTNFIACLIAMVLTLASGAIAAEESINALFPIEGEYVEDNELYEISGKGADGKVLKRPDAVSVILWDEKGGGKKSTQINSTSGTWNVQNVTVRFNRN